MKKHYHTYKIILGLLPILLLGFIFSLHGQDREQFEFKIQYMAEENDSTWGVFVRPVDGFAPGNNDAVVGSGQVTILMRNDGRDSIHNIQSVGGTWNSGYDVVRNACEAPDITYIFIGMKDGDGIVLENGEETLLFTFQVPDGCPDTLGLLDHFDPFLPEESNNCHGNGPGVNSSGNNPGQDLSVFNSSTGRIHNWLGNYAPRAFSCGDCDNDGIVDGIEDTNGDGMYSSPPDSSDICDVCDPLGINMFAATLIGGDTLTMCGEVDEDSVAFMVEFTGGWEPYIIELEERDVATNATTTLTFNDYYPGDRIYVSPTTTSSYRMTRIRDTPPMNDQGTTFCELTDANFLIDTIEVTVEGPLMIDDAEGPFDFTACNLDTLGFGVTASNGGEGIIEYQWQVSTAGPTGPWSDVVDGTPYAFATTDSIIISNPLGLDGNFYRAKVFTETCDTLYSEPAELGVDGPFIIDLEPVDQNACAKEDPVYFHAETSVGQGVFNRRWQVNRNDGNDWVDLAASDTFNFGTRIDLNPTPEIERAYYDTVFVDTAAFYMNQWQFRLAAIGDNIQACTEIYTDEATLNVEGRIFIDDQPDDVLICADTVACFSIAHSNQADNGAMEFQWYVQERGTTTWTALSNDGTYSGARSDTLCVTNPLGRDSFAYRVDVWTTECDIITSEAAFLNIDGPILFDDDPDDIIVCAEEDPNIFAVETWMGQGALNRRWQISTDDGATWDYLTISGVYSLGIDSTSNPAPGFEIAYHDTLHINTATSSMDQYQYRLAVIGQSGGNCEETYSGEALLTVEGPITIDPANQPVDVFICSDTTACFSVLVDSESSSGIIEYQWYVKERGGTTWAPVANDGTYSGVRTDTLCVTNVLGRDGFSYHVRVQTGLCQTILSDSAFLQVDGPISFNTDAEDITVCADEDPNIFAVETYMGQGILNRRWQVNRNDGNDWVDLAIAAPFSLGIDSLDNPDVGFEKAYYDTLHINTADASMNQWQFRLAAIGQNSNNCEDSYTVPVTLTVEGAIDFVVQPVDVAICSDTAACFGVTISSETGEGTILYQWYEQARGTTSWTPLSNDGNYSGVRSDTLCVTNVLGRDSFLYRVEVRTGLCATITSDSSLLRVDGPITFNANPEDFTVCGSEDADYFAVETFMGQGVLDRRWQVNRNDGNDWVDLTIGGIYSLGIDSIANPPLGEGAEIAYYDTLHINTADASMNQWQFRLAATGQNSNNCTDIFSREAVVTVEGPLSIVVQPESVYLCSDTAACFGVSIINETMEGNVQYQWYIQEKGDAPTDWTPLSSSDGRYAGVRSDTLCVLFIAGQDSTRYRVGISSNMCNEVLSDPALLQVDGPIAFVTDPSDETICAEEDDIYFVSEATIGQGRMNTFWEVSTDDGASWNTVNLSDPNFSESNRVIGDANTPSNTADSIYYDTLFIARVDNTMDQWRYRNTAGGLLGSGCEDVNSADAILTVEGLISVTIQPVDVSICSDTAACFGVSVANETMRGDIKYQWQTQAPGSTDWITLTSAGGRYGGVTSDTLCVNNVTGLDSFLYRVYIYTNTCANVYSDSARLNVAGPVDYVAEPQEASICANEDATFFNAETTIGQGGLVTRWELSEDDGVTWNIVDQSLPVYTFSSSKEANASPDIDSTYYDTLHINPVATADMDGNLYRLVSSGLNGTSCKDIPTDPAELIIHGPLTVLAHPQDDVVCSGKPGLFRVNVANAASGDVTFLWQYSLAENSPWYDIDRNTSVYNGGRDSVLSISDVASVVRNERDSIFYRVIYGTNLCDGDTSDIAQLRVEGPFEFDSPENHPHDTIVCAGETIIFNANPTNYGFGDMMFQWKVNTTGLPTDWADADLLSLTGGGTVTGAQTTQLVIDPSVDDRALLDSALFRLDITSGVCPDETSSETAIVRIDGQLTFTQQPQDTVNCADKGVIFFANINNEGFGGNLSVQYRWEEYDHGTMTWREIQNEGVYNGASTDTLSIDITTGLDSNQYRVVAWTAVCNEVTSDAAYLIEEGSVEFVDHPVDVIICSGEATSFSARMVNSTGQGDNILNWQISTNNGISWSNIDTGTEPLFSDDVTGPNVTPALDDSTTTEMFTTLSVSDVEGMQGYRFRAAATSTFCDTVYSQLAKLTVEGPFLATLTGPATVCANEGTVIEANVVNLGAGLPQLTWQYKGPDSTDFANVPTDWGIFHGEETNGIGIKTLTIDSVLNEPSRLNDNAIVDTFFTLNNYDFRLAIVSDTCEVAVYSDTFTLNVVSDRIGGCDWDLDGLDNTTDLDDDNDGLTDSVEAYITTYPGSEPQDSINQFDTDTDNNNVTDNEEDADEDTISNGEEVDDDDGDGQADGVNSTTGVFTGFPAMPDTNDEDADDIFNGDPLDPCDPILSPSCIGVVLDINVKLQGAMPDLGFDTGENNLMDDNLRKSNLLPIKSPYEDFKVRNDSTGNIEPAFVHIMRDSVAEEVPMSEASKVFGDMGYKEDKTDNAVVDWVFVEIRDGSKLDSVVTTRAALLQRDGDVRDHRVFDDPRRMDEDGYSYLTFDSTLAGDYYVVVRHRNHLGVMTNTAGLYSPIVTRVDFTDKDFNALGIHSQRMNFDSTEQYMWAGDVTSDRKIIYQGPGNDIDDMFFRVIGHEDNQVDNLDNFIVPGYYRTDYNLDGKSIFQGPNNDRQMLIFQSILQFPDNKVKFLANYVILEQLP